MLEHATGTVSFFQTMAPILIANVLTVTFVYCFAKIHQSLPERKRVVSFCCSCRALHLDPIGKA